MWKCPTGPSEGMPPLGLQDQARRLIRAISCLLYCSGHTCYCEVLMRLLQPVVWTKGTLLTPQHLQAQDNFIENTLDFHMHSLVFRPWGFTQLSIDRRALEGGTFSLTRAVGILPDGLLFHIPDSDAAPAPKSLSGSFEPGQDCLQAVLAPPPPVVSRINGTDVSPS